jgi:tetratricopeptide (TPR) repeat protein
MDDIFALSPAAESLFTALSSAQTNRSTLAQGALSSGADLSLKGDYAGAAREFRRALGLDGSPSAALKALDLLATTYLQMNDIGGAMQAYQQAIKISPESVDPHLHLGNIYFSQQRFQEAAAEYNMALRNDPTNTTSILSVGQTALALGEYAEAEQRFRAVISASPNEYGGYYALGQLYSRMGRPNDAVPLFEQVVAMAKDFSTVHVDLGSAYADIGAFDAANRELSLLRDADPELANVLSAHIDQVTQPRMLAAVSPSGFRSAAGAGTRVAQLSPQLATANAVKTFDMDFYFSKPMDAQAVQTITNWSIGRSTVPLNAYNWGQPVPSTEVQIAPLPIGVIYDAENLCATVVFQVRQNAAADATIDPSHVVFRFSGIDTYGNTMDPHADEYSGITQFA